MDSDIEISASDDTIKLGDDVTAVRDIILNNNTKTAAGITLDAGRNVKLADGMTIAAEGNIYMAAVEDISLGGTNGGSIIANGGVSLIAEKGKIYTPAPDKLGGGNVLNIPIAGYSDDREGLGISLPDATDQKAAIVIISNGADLHLGENAELTASGKYYGVTLLDEVQADNRDNRPGVRFATEGEAGGDSIDVAIYLASLGRVNETKTIVGGNVTVNSAEIAVAHSGGSYDSMDKFGAVVFDAWDTVEFGSQFDAYLGEMGIDHLQVSSRITDLSLEDAINRNSLPYANELDRVSNWFLHKYVLRGANAVADLDNEGPNPASVIGWAGVIREVGGPPLAQFGLRPLELDVTGNPIDLSALKEWVREHYGEEIITNLKFDKDHNSDYFTTSTFPVKSAIELKRVWEGLEANRSLSIDILKKVISESGKELTSENFSDLIQQAKSISEPQRKSVVAWLNGIDRYMGILTGTLEGYTELAVDPDDAFVQVAADVIPIRTEDGDEPDEIIAAFLQDYIYALKEAARSGTEG